MPNALARQVRAGDRRSLGRLITLLESTRPDLRNQGVEALNELMPATGQSLRLGISGVPGVGKSTFIEAFGMERIGEGKKVAVLAVDPSSPISGGSILGDRTRMAELSSQENAFIRPSPTSGTLGGVARHTREAILAVEAAGYDLVLVETVGVGQSEALAASMVDSFVILQLPNAGDELQGIKKGVLELADLVVVTKCDGVFEESARQAAQDIKHALALTRGQQAWQPEVLTASSVNKTGLAEVWEAITRFEAHQQSTGAWAKRRSNQAIAWLNEETDAILISKVRSMSQFKTSIAQKIEEVRNGKVAASTAAADLVNTVLTHLRP